MFQRTYQKIVVGVLLLILGIYGPYLVYNIDVHKLAIVSGEMNLIHRHRQPSFMPSTEVVLIDKQQEMNPSLEKVKYSNEQQQFMSHNGQPQPNLPPSTEVKLIYKQQQVTLSPEYSNEQQPTSHDGQQPSKLPPFREVKLINNEQQQQHMSYDLNRLVDASYDETAFRSYIVRSPPSLTEYLLKQFGITNLNSRTSKSKVLQCAVMGILQQLKGKPLNTTIHVPQNCQRCNNMSFKSSGSVISLSSHEGSGNSWVRQLLESATGIYTGAMYCDLAYINNGMFGEYVVDNSVLAVKNHVLTPSRVKRELRSDKAIFIVRSPFGTLLADENRRLTKSHTSMINFTFANNTAWYALIRRRALAWKRYIAAWLNAREFPVLFVGYDNLKKDTYNQLKRMLDFIGHPYTEENVLCAIKTTCETFRRQRPKNWHPFPPELQKSVLNEIKQVDAGLLKHNISLYHPYDGS